jgi:hypothetical protein
VTLCVTLCVTAAASLPPPPSSCGAWPSGKFEEQFEQLGIVTDDMAWQCADYKKRDVMSTRGLNGQVTADACSQWCVCKYL